MHSSVRHGASSIVRGRLASDLGGVSDWREMSRKFAYMHTARPDMVDQFVRTNGGVSTSVRGKGCELTCHDLPLTSGSPMDHDFEGGPGWGAGSWLARRYVGHCSAWSEFVQDIHTLAWR